MKDQFESIEIQQGIGQKVK